MLRGLLNRLYGDRVAVTPNEPNGITFVYYLKEQAKDKVTLTVTDASGKTVRTLDGAAKAGMNRVVWSLGEGAGQFGGGGFRPPGAESRAAPPGEYSVTLQVSGKQFTRKARVLANNPASIRVLERLDLELVWQGDSSAGPTGPDDTTHLERLVFADRPLDEAMLREVIALGAPDELPGLIWQTARPGDVVVCLGAGNITAWAHALPEQIQRLASEHAGLRAVANDRGPAP